MESFPGALLRTLVSSCAARSSQLPVQLVFGLATSLEAVQARLGAAGIAKLSIQKFSALSAVRLFAEAFNEVGGFFFYLAHFVSSFIRD